MPTISRVHQSAKNRLRERLRAVEAVDYVNAVITGYDARALKALKRAWEDSVCRLAGWDEDDRVAMTERLDQEWEDVVLGVCKDLAVEDNPHRLRAAFFAISKFIPDLKQVEVVNNDKALSRSDVDGKLLEMGLDPEQVWAQLPSK